MEKPEFTSAGQPQLDQHHTRGRFADCTAVVSGGASGIGYAVAERFASDGARVVVLDMDADRCQLAETRFAQQGWKLTTRVVDVTDKDTVEQTLREVIGSERKVDALVTSAAYFGSQGERSTSDDWRKSFDVNVVGVSNLVQSSLPYLKKSDRAAIVTLSSISAIRAQRDRWTYSATKGAIKTITKNMALDLAKYHVRVNSVSPGWIWSPEAAKASPDGTMKTLDEKVVKNFKLTGRSGYSSEVAAAITFLCSKDASYITGTNLMVDGGYSAIGPERHGQDSPFAGHQQRT